ncbi:MAG: alpha/beta hydrolase [Elusimicrobia bacterium]|nr:alpha/beta hydrolase [Elusimicrobiota bacterium]
MTGPNPILSSASCQRAASVVVTAALLASGTRAADFPLTRTLVAETLHERVYEVSFPSPHKSPWPANDTVWGRLVVPKGRARPPAVLLLPIMAAPNAWIEERFARELSRRGLAAMWIEMPTQFRRRPHPSMPSGQGFLARSPKRLAANFRQAVADARRSLDVLEAEPEVDGSRLAVLGVSLGALVGSVAFASDPRPLAAVFCLGGADFTDLVYRSEMTGPLLKQLGLDPAELVKEWRGLDPLELPRGRERPVTLVNARSDKVIPPENGRRLAEAFPGATQLWVPGGHYTAILHMAWMPSYAALKLGRVLDP